MKPHKRLEWDETKSRTNLWRHGIDFAEVAVVFRGAPYTNEDDRYDYGETRYLTLGLLRGRVVAIVHTETESVIRIISARWATNMKKSNTLKKDGTDYERLDAMRDEDIDFSEIPPITDEMLARGVVRQNVLTQTKEELTLRIDTDVLEWFQSRGRGWETLINFLLRRYMQEE